MQIELREAQDRLAAFDKTYPQLAEWKRRNADLCKLRGYVRISAANGADEGRIHRFSWNAAPKPGARDKREFSYTQSCNLPVRRRSHDSHFDRGTIVVAAGMFIIWRERRLGLRRGAARKVVPPQG